MRRRRARVGFAGRRAAKAEGGVGSVLRCERAGGLCLLATSSGTAGGAAAWGRVYRGERASRAPVGPTGPGARDLTRLEFGVGGLPGRWDPLV
jgi:hypothetical protein